MPDNREIVLLLGKKKGQVRRLALSDLFMGHRDRLRRMVALRLDLRVLRRVDPSDVLQEVFLEAARRLDRFLEDPQVPLFIWLRHLTGQRIRDVHRFHLGARARDARREVPFDQGPLPEASSASIAAQIVASGSSPLDRALKAESAAKVQAALERMDPLDREVLVMRHFELLTSAEAAKVLDLKPPSVRSRYLRALKRLGELLSGSQSSAPEGSR